MAAEVRCYKCEYDLRGTDASGVCPECGTAVAESAARQALVGNFTWVKRVRWGAAVLLTGLVCTVMMGLFAALTGSVGSAMGALGIAAVAWGVGWWLIGSQPPERLAKEWAGLPEGIRLAVYVEAVAGGIAVLLAAAGGWSSGLVEGVGVTLGVISIAAMVANWVMGMLLIASIGDWAQDESLRWGAGIGLPLPVLGPFLVALSSLVGPMGIMATLIVVVAWVPVVWGMLWWRCWRLLAG